MNQYFKGKGEKKPGYISHEDCHSERSEEPMHPLAAQAMTASTQVLQPAKSAGLRMTGLLQCDQFETGRTLQSLQFFGHGDADCRRCRRACAWRVRTCRLVPCIERSRLRCDNDRFPSSPTDHVPSIGNRVPANGGASPYFHVCSRCADDSNRIGCSAAQPGWVVGRCSGETPRLLHAPYSTR
jgi:hypothetical protein